MPFKSKSQLAACFAKNDPNWDCKKWAKETKSVKKLPEAVKEANLSFKKIAEALFNPAAAPPVPAPIKIKHAIETVKEQKLNGMSPVQYKRDAYMKRQGIAQRNKESAAK